MRTLRIERSDFSSKRQRRDLAILILLAATTIGAVLLFVPHPAFFTDSFPKGVEQDWTFRIGTFDFGLLADRHSTFIACGSGYITLPVPLLVFLGCSLLLACLPLIWAISRSRRHETWSNREGRNAAE
jgi:hypothetical protein